MSLHNIARRLAPMALALTLATGLAACDTGMGGFMRDKVEGYDLSPDGLAQIRNGQSQQLVSTVLGSPQMTNDFGGESAWYYVSSNVTETSFGLQKVNSRTVLAIYFDKSKKVKDRAVYGLKDGRQFTVETRRTPSFGEDKTFISSVLGSFTGSDQTASAQPKL